jgi:release factor glutamine methyltransferase
VIARSFARDLAPRLKAAGVPDALFEAELITRAAGGLSRAQYLAGEALDDEAERRARSLADRRLQREPTAYVTGYREFYGRLFRVTPDVLIPRPETELLVDVVLAELREVPSAVVADVGTGSGCIATSIALERPKGGRTIAIDRSVAALAVATENARHHRAAVACVLGDLAAPLRQADIIVANLPYIPSAEIADLQREVRDWEPRIALDGGIDGLALVRRLVEDCASRLRPSFLALEIGLGQAQEVADLLQSRGDGAMEIHKDLAGIERVVTARWR